jgi:poly(A) polymerase
MAYMTKREAAEEVRHRLTRRGYKAYYVGGCVRDTLLGRIPKDYDITTSATPEQVKELFEKTIPVGERFGVTIVHVVSDRHVEVATFRKDGAYSDGRHPDTVEYSTDPADDVWRRDFTVNGLLMKTLNVSTVDENVIDYVGGMYDMKRNQLRAIGKADDRFTEDPLRMLRAIRFAAQLKFKIEIDTWESICRNIRLIHQISMERVRDELVKMLTSKRPTMSLCLLASSGLFGELLPELQSCNFPTVMQKFSHFRPFGPLMALAVLLSECQHLPVADKVLRRLRLSNADRTCIMNGLMNTSILWQSKSWDDATVKRTARYSGIDIAVDLFEMEAKLNRLNHPFINDAFRVCERFRNLSREDINPPRLITGKDLIELGYAPGPEFHKILKEVETRQLNGELTTKDAALDWVCRGRKVDASQSVNADAHSGVTA